MPAAHKNGGKVKWLRWAGTLLSSVLFVWLLARQDWESIWSTVARLRWWLPLLAVGLYALFNLGVALRWFLLLRSQDIPVKFKAVLKVTFSAAFASNFLPSTIGGDSVRMLSVGRFTDNWTSGIATVVMDRILGGMTMVAMLPFTLMVFGGGTFEFGSVPLAAGLLGGGLKQKLAGVLEKARETLRIWLHRPGVLALGFVIALAARMMTFLALWSLARGLGIVVSLPEVMGVASITYILTLLPISVNGLGMREITMTSLYVYLGSSVEQAAALALVSRFASTLQTLPGALWLSEIVPGGKIPETSISVPDTN
ncbi:MAG: flippase-like domain-containing protein [Anaerolineales bacterium]|nr:flippase-like domain-containing protein [Anaerolineales bacterium]